MWRGFIIGFVAGFLVCFFVAIALFYTIPQFDGACTAAFQRAHSGTDTVAIIRATSCKPKASAQ